MVPTEGVAQAELPENVKLDPTGTYKVEIDPRSYLCAESVRNERGTSVVAPGRMELQRDGQKQAQHPQGSAGHARALPPSNRLVRSWKGRESCMPPPAPPDAYCPQLAVEGFVAFVV